MKSVRLPLLSVSIAFGLFVTGCAIPAGTGKPGSESNRLLRKWSAPALNLRESIRDQDSFPTAVAPLGRKSCRAGST